MKQPIIYHNPRCSKSREALALLVSRGFTPQIIEYLKTPMTIEELFELTRMLKFSARDILRKKEPEYKALGLENPLLSDQEIILQIIKHPTLLERPIIIYNKRAVIGRPTEAILSII